MNIINSIEIKEKSFGVEPEITMKLARKKFIFYEVPISYRGRTYEEGKKITLSDALKAIYCIIKYSPASDLNLFFFRRKRSHSPFGFQSIFKSPFQSTFCCLVRSSLCLWLILEKFPN